MGLGKLFSYGRAIRGETGFWIFSAKSLREMSGRRSVLSLGLAVAEQLVSIFRNNLQSDGWKSELHGRLRNYYHCVNDTTVSAGIS